MRKLYIAIFSVIILAGCQQSIKPEDLNKLNGYWEIEKVILPDGNKKEYKINETIDYFEIKNNLGFRKKVMPQLDGEYLQNGHAEKIKARFKDGNAYLDYTTEYGKWKEQIITLSDKELVLKNDSDLEYHYKKPMPFSIK